MKSYLWMKCISVMLAGGSLVCTQLARAATITVTSTADTIAVDGQVTLREAITSANSNSNLNTDVVASGAYGNDTIVFAPGVTGTITVTGSLLPMITGNLVITGPGVNALNIVSNVAGSNTRSDVFLVGSAVSATFNSLKIHPGLAATCIDNTGGNLNVNNCSLEGDGLSIYTQSGIQDNPASGVSPHIITITNSTVKGLFAGVYNTGNTLNIRGSTLYNCDTSMQSNGGATSLTNCTFTGNRQAIAGISAGPTVNHCTIAGNTYGFVTNGQTATRINTICIDPAPSGFVTTFNDLGNNITSGNPMLGPLANNGGPTLTMSPLPGSPAIDQAVSPSSSPSLTTDQRGYPRPMDDPNVTNAVGGNGSDIGAVEVLGRNKVFINSVTQVECNALSTTVYFTVSLMDPATATAPVTVYYATQNGTATAPSDYTTAWGSLTFGPGQKSKTIGVAVKGDTMVEPNEDFVVNLSSATNADVIVGQGTCTIVNDD